ncbi:MAG: acyltransferase family protein [Acidimicrobiales bacterium]
MAGASRAGSRLAHEPALDGLRGLAVAAVLLFHAEVPGTTGGYLGVSVFFTLSGFLITRLLLAERAETGRLAVRSVLRPGERRLVPASAACLLAIAVLAHLGAWGTVAGLRRDLAGAALQVFNWVRLAGDSATPRSSPSTAAARARRESTTGRWPSSSSTGRGRSCSAWSCAARAVERSRRSRPSPRPRSSPRP